MGWRDAPVIDEEPPKTGWRSAPIIEDAQPSRGPQTGAWQSTVGPTPAPTGSLAGQAIEAQLDAPGSPARELAAAVSPYQTIQERRSTAAAFERFAEEQELPIPPKEPPPTFEVPRIPAEFAPTMQAAGPVPTAEQISAAGRPAHWPPRPAPFDKQAFEARLQELGRPQIGAPEPSEFPARTQTVPTWAAQAGYLMMQPGAYAVGLFDAIRHTDTWRILANPQGMDEMTPGQAFQYWKDKPAREFARRMGEPTGAEPQQYVGKEFPKTARVGSVLAGIGELATDVAIIMLGTDIVVGGAAAAPTMIGEGASLRTRITSKLASIAQWGTLTAAVGKVVGKSDKEIAADSIKRMAFIGFAGGLGGSTAETGGQFAGEVAAGASRVYFGMYGTNLAMGMDEAEAQADAKDSAYMYVGFTLMMQAGKLTAKELSVKLGKIAKSVEAKRAWKRTTRELGISEKPTVEEINAALRNYRVRMHPDVAGAMDPATEAAFHKKIALFNSVLADAKAHEFAAGRPAEAARVAGRALPASREGPFPTQAARVAETARAAEAVRVAKDAAARAVVPTEARPKVAPAAPAVPTAAIAAKPAREPPKPAEAAEKPLTLYHGTGADFADADIAGGKKMYGIHLTSDAEAAKDYGAVKKYELDPKAKGLDLSDGEDLWAFMQKKGLLDQEQLENPDLKARVLDGRLFQYDLDNKTHLADFVAKEAESDGYDVVMLGDDLGGKGDDIAYVVVNKDVLSRRAGTKKPEVAPAIAPKPAAAAKPKAKPAAVAEPEAAVAYLRETYGPVDVANAHNAPWLTPSGELVGNLADHQESAVKTLAHLGVVASDEYEAVKELQRKTGIARITITDDEVNLDTIGEPTDQQIASVASIARKGRLDVLYDVYDEAGKNVVRSGRGLRALRAKPAPVAEPDKPARPAPVAEAQVEKQPWEIVSRRGGIAVKWQRGDATISAEVRRKTKAGTGGRRYVARVGEEEYRALTQERAQDWADEALAKLKKPAQPAAEAAPKAEKTVFGEAGRKAQERINARSRGEKPAAGIDPGAIKDWVQVGLMHAENVIRKVGKLTKTAWVKAMRAANPKLKAGDMQQIWGLVKKDPGLAKITAKPVAVAPPPAPGRETGQLAERMITDAAEDGLAVADEKMATYQAQTRKEWIAAAEALPRTQAERIALGQERAPLDVKTAAVFELAKWRAVADRDVLMLDALAGSPVVEEMSKLGQEIAAAGVGNPLDPMAAIERVNTAAKEAAKRRTGKADPKKVADLESRLADVNRELQEAVAKFEQTERENAMMKADRELSKRESQARARKTEQETKEKPRAKRRATARNKIFTDERWESAKAELREALAGVHEMISHTPVMLAKLAKAATIGAGRYIEAGGRSAAEWGKMMVKEFGGNIKPVLKNAWVSANAELREAKRGELIVKIETGLAKGKAPGKMQTSLRDLYRIAIAEGVKGIDARLDAVHAELEDAGIEMTREDVRDGVSGYGTVSQPSQEALEVELRENMAQHRELAKLRDMVKGEAPMATGMRRDKPSQTVRGLQKQVADAKKRGGYVTVDPVAQLQSAVDTMRTRLTNEIADLDEQIAAGKRVIREKADIEYPPDIKALVARRNASRKLLNAIDPKRTTITDEQRLNRAVRHYDRQISKNQEALAKGLAEKPEKRTWRDAPESPAKAIVARKARQAKIMGKQLSTIKGLTLSDQQRSNIVDLAATALAAKEAMEAGPRRGPSDIGTDAELAYGQAARSFTRYTNELHEAANAMTLQEALRNPVTAVWSGVKGTANLARSLKAAWDNSFIGRQGIRALFTSDFPDLLSAPVRRGLKIGHKGPRFVWTKTLDKSLDMIWDTYGGENVIDNIMAEIVSDPDYEIMLRMKVAIGTVEEEMPSRIPFVRKATKWATKPEGGIARRLGRQVAASPIVSYEASQNAFTGSAYYMRYQLARKYIDIARKSGVDLNDKQTLLSIGRVINSLTARGGTLRKPGLVNALLWAPKNYLGHVDVLTLHTLSDIPKKPGERLTPWARKQAAINLLEVVGGMAGVLALASMIPGVEIEWDPRSPNFGQIKIGNTRIDITGGMRSIVTLAARLITLTTESSTTGKISRLDTREYGAKNAMDVITDFFTNKAAPLPSEIIKHIKGEDPYQPWVGGKPVKPTFMSSLKNLFLPFPADTAEELLSDPRSANFFAAMLAEQLGFSANTYPTALPREAGALLTIVEEREYVHQVNKDAGKRIDPAELATTGRLSRAADLVWDIRKAQVKKETDLDAMLDRTRSVAELAVAGKRIFGEDGLSPRNPAELKFAYREAHYAAAEAAINGADFDLRAAIKRTDESARKLGISRQSSREKISNAGRGQARSEYHDRLADAALAGDVEAAVVLLKASKALDVGRDARQDAMTTRLKTKQQQQKAAATLKAIGIRLD